MVGFQVLTVASIKLLSSGILRRVVRRLIVLMVEAEYVNNYQRTRCSNPEDTDFQLQCIFILAGPDTVLLRTFFKKSNRSTTKYLFNNFVT